MTLQTCEHTDQCGRTSLTDQLITVGDHRLCERHASTPEALEAAIQAAAQHGRDSDPDHEVGDLQTLARSLWAHLLPLDRARALREYATTLAATPHADDVDDDEAEADPATTAA